MKTADLTRIVLALAAVVGIRAHAAEPAAKMYAIPSWGDYTLVYGPGTDPAMDSPQAMENMFRFWKGHGYTGVFLRSDLQQYDPFVRRNPRVQMNPGLALMWRYIDEMARKYDPFTAAQQAAERTGLEFWVYHPHIYSEGAPEDVGEDGPGRMVPWSYVSKVLFENPEFVSIDRRGNKYWMVPEYAYPAVRAAKVQEFVHMARKYGVKRFIPNMRSEVNQLIAPADHADRFGFNQPVAEDMQRLHGVDIRTDPRFDIDSPAFNAQDPMLGKWRDLRGGYLTQLFRELRQALRAVDPQIRIGVTLAGEHIGPPLGNWRTDWRTWVDEGLVDYLISPVFFEATLDRDAEKKGYLTNALAGVGTVTHEALRAYIRQSKHPEIEIIATGGPPYFFTPPQAPPGADGRQCDVWYSSYHLAWQQRWAQFQRDVRELGHIKFLEQNFDDVRLDEIAGKSGAWGLLAYDPQRRACPGAWWRLGDGSDGRPAPQSEVRRGASGQAMRLTSTRDGTGTLTGWHLSSPDRGKLTAALDTSITNGRCEFAFWLWRSSAGSGLAAYLQGDGTQCDVGVRVAPQTGRLSYSTGTKAGAGVWVETGHAVGIGQWEKLTITVDLDHRSYAADLGEHAKTRICEGVPLVMPAERFVEQAGVNIPIPVPVFKEFQRVAFVPEGAPGEITVVDDVALHWMPTLHFVEHGERVLLAEDFEAVPAEHAFPMAPLGNSWKTHAPGGFQVTNGVSFGAGVSSLRADGKATLTGELPGARDPGTPLIVDLDVFIRSGEGFPYLLPNPATRSRHATEVAIARASGERVAGVSMKDDRWQIWDGSAWRDTGVRVHYDVWNRVQLALNGSGSCQLTVQPAGQVPAHVATGQTRPSAAAETLKLRIAPSRTEGHVSLYDNITVTAGKAAP